MSVGSHRRLIAIGLGGLAVGAPSLGALGCGSSSSSSSATASSSTTTGTSASTGAASSGSVAVTTADFSFTPKLLTVKAGTTVTWTNRGSTTHNVKGPGFFSQALDPGKSYSHRFTTPGRIPYLCTLHPSLMKGTIVVS